MWTVVKISSISFAALSNFLLGLLVLFRNPKNRINITFFLFSLFFSIWAFCLLFYEFPTMLSSIFWIKSTYFVVSILVVIGLAFSFIFPTVIFRRLWFWAGLSSVVFLSFTVWLLFFTRSWIIGVIIDPNKGLQTLLGYGYIWWLLLIWAIGIWSFINLVVKARHSSGLQKMQLRYIFYGYAFWAITINIPDTIIPLFFSETRYFSASPIFNLCFSAAIAYTILKHRLMDIRLVVARTVSYTLLSVILITFYTTSLFVIGHWVFPTPLNGSQLIISVALALVVAYTFQPLRRFLERATDDIFYKENYDPEEPLGRISRILGTTLDLEKLTQRVLKELLSTLHLEGGSFLLSKDHRLERVIGYSHNDKKIEFTSKQVEFLLSKRNHLLIFDEVKEGRLKELMRKNNLGAFLKLSVKGDVIAILLLGNKLSGDTYSHNDIEVLEILGPHLAVAIQNAQQYEEIKQFSEKLKVEVKKATADLQEANEKLKELDKRKNEFVSVVSHELRAPMTAIKGYISMILEGDTGKISPKAKEFLQEATEGNERLIRLVNNMLNVSKIEEERLTYRMGIVKLGQVAKEVFNDFKLEAEDKNLEISLDTPSDLKDQVYVDQDRIHEVVANLIGNAVKYTDKGSVTIRLSQSRKDIVRLEVADTGPGIPPQDQKKLFQKFARLDSGTGKQIGSGLGLYISKLLIKEFEGKIGVQSEVDKGSLFWFELPIKTPKPS